MSGQPIRVLVIEDNPGDAYLVEEYLIGNQETPFVVECRNRLSTGLERLTAGSVDAVLLDLSLPDSQDWLGLDRIISQAPGIPVLILTGLDQEKAALESVSRGAQDYLVKGRFNRPMLVRALHYAIERKRLETALRQSREDLEKKVLERTADLVRANDSLREEMAERQRVEQERHQLELQIQNAQKMESLGILAGGIAHDFNNLLTAILGNASLALLDIPPNSAARGPVQTIEKVTLRAADLTQQMLAYAGKGRLVIEPIQLSRMVEEMAQLLQAIISKKALLRFDFAPSLPLIQGDATQIRQIVMNLLANASDALGENQGVISMRTGTTHLDPTPGPGFYFHEKLAGGPYVFLKVSDTGCGMDLATQKKIFDPFFTTKFTGRGLGLAAVLGIVHGHRGAIKVTSKPGQGTTFEVFFPVAPTQEEAAPPASPHLATVPCRGTILVVEDEKEVRTMIQYALEKAGLQVLNAEDGRQGLNIFRNHERDIAAVFLDLNMPHLDGREVFREIQNLRPEVPVVLMTGYHQQEAAQEFPPHKLAGWMQKPFGVEEILTMCKKILRV